MPQTTHDVVLGERTVEKRFRSFDRGEAEREWAGLGLLHRHAPGLAPEPLGRRTDAGVPVVVMRRVPGVPLGADPVRGDRLRALASTVRRLHSAVPAEHLAGLPERRMGPGELLATLRGWPDPEAPVGGRVAEALVAARTWTGTSEAAELGGPLRERVFGLGDGNLANVLWDGEVCRVVDLEDCGASDPAYEVADLLEHVSAWLPGLVDPVDLVALLGLTAEQRSRVAGFRRMFAVFWLLMLLPGGPGHDRNPPGSLERQAERLLSLLRGEGS